LLGGQGEERVTAEELGSRAGTINYEITTGIDPRRVERSYEHVRGS
jgi:alanine racemase